MIHLFGDCALDEARFELRRRGAVVKVEPKTFDVLLYLVKSGDRVVSKDELLDAVWPGQAVSESVLPKCVAAARRAVSDGAARSALIQTVHGRGYRFVAEVRAETGHAGDAATEPAPFRTVFVGHTHAMARLRAGLEDALSGHGRMVLVAGEPGIGKTRTAEELAAEARRRGALVLIGRAYEGEGAPAFWPWLQLLRSGAGLGVTSRSHPEARELNEIFHELAEGAETHGGVRAAEAEQARFRLFDTVTSALDRAARRQPLVVVLDDLHWADEASLRLFGFMAGAIAAARILAIGTYRDVELRRGHPLGDLLGRLAREPVCDRVVLRGFERPDTERLIAAVAGATVPVELAGAVHEMTEGNPFFIQEMVRLLAATDALSSGAAARTLTLPQSVRDAIGRRLDGLSAACNGVLRIAAVLGREFDAPLLGRVAELAEGETLERVTEAVQARVVDQADGHPGRFRFHHSLIRQTLYDELTALEQVRLHARAGAALEAAYGADIDLVLDELAHHFFQAAPGGSADKAVAYCARAAERAQQRLAYEQGARQYERALQVLELYGARDEAQRGALLVAVGEAHALAGARDRAGAAFLRAAQVGRELRNSQLLALAALGCRGAGEMGTPADPQVLTLLDEAIAAVGDASPSLRARLLNRLVGAPPHSESMAEREALSGEALALARGSGDPAALRDALEARLWACLGPDHLDDRLAVARELLALGESQHNPHMSLLAYEAELGAHLVRGDLAAADRALTAFTQVAEALRQPAVLFFATFYQGSRAVAAGELARAEALFRDALARGRGTVPYAHFMCIAQLYVLTYLRGAGDDPELNRVFFGEMMAVPYSWEPAMRSALAFSHYLRGERDTARREFEAVAAPGFDCIRRDEHWLATLGSLSSVAVLLGDRERAARLYDLLLPYADLVFVHDLLRSVGGVVGSALGGLAALLGRFDEGERHFERAHVLETAMGGLTAVVDRPAYARLLFLRNRPGDRERAATVLAQALSGMERLGIKANWQLIANEEIGLTPGAPPATARSRRARRT